MTGLSAAELTLWRGPDCLFDDLSFDVAPGSLPLVCGPNGSGKTTLLRLSRASSKRITKARPN